MIRPLSLHLRLGLMSVLMVCATLWVTTWLLANLVTTVLSDNMDIPLDAQIRTLRHAIGPDGRLDTASLSWDLQHPATGWGWEVVTPQGRWERSLPRPVLEYPVPLIHPVDGIYSGRDAATKGLVLHARRMDLSGSMAGGRVLVVSPEALIQQPLDRVAQEIHKFAGLGLAVLLLACWVQIGVGLRPLRQLGGAIARIRSGEAQSLPARQPAELAPLAQEINALIARNERGLETARRNAANLAHAVKTPLSTLMLQLEQEQASAEARALVAHVSERVAHHLRRARSAAVGLGGRPRADVHEAVEALRPVLASLGRGGGADRLLHIENRVMPPCPVAVDAEDLSEMLGNLLENACRYARSHISVEAGEDGRWLVLDVSDDGPGIPPAGLETVLQPGVRLDEVSEGYGLGLAITRELAEMYEGTLTLGPASARGGLKASLKLPR
ncbi:sensor histidine kinase [Novosphingobium terrae]|uniref:sensor histidine kinase n=1 Tax=Novosphingobium terrae TaxID=2726189 RepID=UPI00197E1D48|nr:HAMP domain-containing sensor histidine kinase [Novosphingobium terrae]